MTSLPSVIMPQLSGGRERARTLTAPLIDKMLGQTIQLDCRELIAGTASFADEIVVQVLVEGHADQLLVRYADGDFAEYLAEAAKMHGHGDQIAFD